TLLTPPHPEPPCGGRRVSGEARRPRVRRRTAISGPVDFGALPGAVRRDPGVSHGVTPAPIRERALYAGLGGLGVWHPAVRIVRLRIPIPVPAEAAARRPCPMDLGESAHAIC